MIYYYRLLKHAFKLHINPNLNAVISVNSIMHYERKCKLMFLNSKTYFRVFLPKIRHGLKLNTVLIPNLFSWGSFQPTASITKIMKYILSGLLRY